MQNRRSVRSRKTLLAASMIVASGLAGRGALAQEGPLNLPPLNGFQPLVVIGMSDEQVDGQTFDAFAKIGTTPGGNGVPSNTLPVGGAQKFFIAVIDTGAQSNIFSFATAAALDLDGAGRRGGYEQQIIGASGSEFAEITDPLGIYMTGLNNAVGGAQLGVTGGAAFNGMWNTSPLAAETGSVLPNIIGSPVVGLYQTSIKNSQPFHVTVGGTTYRSPLVSFTAPNTAVSATYGKIALTTTNIVGGPPTYFPSLDNFDNFGDNPTLPTVWESMFANVTSMHTAGNSTDSFLFDTGAEVSVLSETTAANIGIYTTGENATPPDFSIEVVGVGGQTNEVPGWYINGMSMTSTSGPLNFSRVPIIVLNLPDPRNPNQVLPGIIGTNLFTARDLVINIGTGNSFLYVSPQWAWKTNGSGNWSNPGNWNLALPNGIDTQANFFSAITSPATVTVDSNFTVGSIAFDNANRYTLAGSGVISMQSSLGPAQINVNSGSHTIAAPVTLLSDLAVSVSPAAAVLTISSDVSAAGRAIDKLGPGKLEMKNVRAGSLTIDQGSVQVLSNGTNSGASRITSLTIDGGATPTAKLDLTNNAMVLDYTGGSPAATIRAMLKAAFNNGAWNGNGITSAAAAAQSGASHKTAVGYAEDFAVGSPGTWFGQNADTTSLLFRYVYSGDATLNNTVDTTDFNLLAANFGGTSRRWDQADFNYDGSVDTLDFNALASNFGLTLPGDSFGSLIPEPASSITLAAASLLMAARRRRSQDT